MGGDRVPGRAGQRSGRAAEHVHRVSRRAQRSNRGKGGARLSVGGKWPVGRSDADGAFDVSAHPMPRPGAIPRGLRVRAKGYAPRQVLATDLRTDGNRILLSASTTVRGVVVDPDGRPQPGIEVTSWRAHTPEPLTPEEQSRWERWGRKRPKLAVEPPHCSRVRTDEQGAFTVEAAVDAPCRIAVDAWPYEAAAELLAPPREPVTLTLRLQDQYHRMLAVRVRDEAGHPLPGVSVTWWTVLGSAGTGMGRSSTAPARTNGDGLASVWTNRNWTRPVLFYAWAPGWFGVSRAPVDRQRLAEPAEVVCAPTRTIRGRAVGTRLHPGARASLWLRINDDAWWRVQLVRLAKDGRFLLPGAPAVAATLIVASPDGFSLRRELEAGTGDLGDLALDTPVVTRGVVRTASGAPEAGAFVSWQPKRPFYRQVFIRNSFLDRLKANANGEFAIPVWRQGIVHVSAQGGPFMEIPGHGAKIPIGNAVTLEHEPGIRFARVHHVAAVTIATPLGASSTTSSRAMVPRRSVVG